MNDQEEEKEKEEDNSNDTVKDLDKVFKKGDIVAILLLYGGNKAFILGRWGF